MGAIWARCSSRHNQNSRASAYAIKEADNDNQPKQYSWDKPMDRNPRDFVFDGIRDKLVRKLPGEINGQQFVIQNCHNATILLFDHSATVNVDDSENCTIMIGPCRGSIFVRDCSNLRLQAACQQFRTRDCKNLDVMLLCTTMPILEESSRIRLACLQLHYKTFFDQLAAASLSPFTNNWSKAHDFTPADGNFSNMDEDVDVAALMKIPRDQLDDRIPSVTYNVKDSDVPLTLGERPTKSDEIVQPLTTCLSHSSVTIIKIVFVLCFCDAEGIAHLQRRCLAMVKAVQNPGSGVRLVNAKQTRIDVSDVERILNDNAFNKLVQNGPAIGLHWVGEHAESTISSYTKSWSGHTVHISTGAVAKQQLQKFKQFTDIQFSA